MSLQLITFDLDNTLWDVDHVITNAETAMRTWLQEHVPEVVHLYDSGEVANIRDAVVAAEPDVRHDLSMLRTRVVQRSIEHTGRNAAEAAELARRAFDVFYEGRHKVSYFEHALEVLDELSRSYTLAALTNGNADFRRLGLDRYFSFGFCSADVGASKPAPDMFHAALKHADAQPHQAVHIGDHEHDDIHGASSVGMHTIWVSFDRSEPEHADPTGTVSSLADLPAEVDRISREHGR